MKKVIYIIFDNFEEIESIVPIDILRRAGACVELVTLNDSLETKGRSNIKVIADKTFAEFASEIASKTPSEFASGFDIIALSGGAGVFEAIKEERLLNLLSQASAENKDIAAICAAPLILKEAGLLDGKKCTGHTSIIAQLGENYQDSPCVEDSNIVTSQGAGTAFGFAFALVNRLFGSEKVKEVAKSICYR